MSELIGCGPDIMSLGFFVMVHAGDMRQGRETDLHERILDVGRFYHWIGLPAL
jgi:hypothetical protein